MFGDEFSVRANRNWLRFTGRAHFKKFPFLSTSPRISDSQAAIEMLYVVFHWESGITLSVKCASNERNRTARHQFADEHYPASPDVSRLSPHVEAQIYFFEVAMQRDRKTEKAGIEKKESDNADEGFAILKIDLGASWNERFKQSGIDDIIQHRQVTPVGGKERFHAANTAVTGQ
jgi:hypothetical protein